MKRTVSCLLLLCLLLGLFAGIPFPSRAAGTKEKQPPRTIAIVFDNSGSMFLGTNTKAWCRATYAVEVFAAMLNEGDKLLVYPMNDIEVNGKGYSKDNPLVISSPDQSKTIRDIKTVKAWGTPLVTIEKAFQGLQKESGEKWLIVLTDGTKFTDESGEVEYDDTEERLNGLLQPYQQSLNVLYLAIADPGSREKPVLPSLGDSGNYVGKTDQARESSEVLAKLTSMCNLIFGRDTMPGSHFDGRRLNADVSLSKLIVFVQGENLSDVTLTGDSCGQLPAVSAYAPHYSEMRGERPTGIVGDVDTSLQGMLLTYENCPADNYTLNYSGSSSSVEFYYEPNVDMEFTFLDENGNEVDPEHLYEGNYTIKYGMKDGVTGQYTDSDLLGNTEYSGHYIVNGEANEFNSSNKFGSTSVSLKMNDEFSADIAVRYLSGYEIYKDSKDFGWPNPITVLPKPSGSLTLELSGGQEVYQLSTLEDGAPFRADVYYEGEKLTGEALESVELTWDPEKSGALLMKEFQDDHWDIVVLYKNGSPDETQLGSFSFPVTALYTPPASTPAESFPVQLSYTIEDNALGLKVELRDAEDYYVISELDEAKPIRAELTGKGAPMAPEDFAKVEFNCFCDGIELETEARPDESAYLIRIKKTDGLKDGRYTIRCTASAADEIGRVSAAKDETEIELGSIPLWLKWLIIGGSLLFLLLLLLLILNIPALPKKLNVRKNDCSMNVDGEDVTKNTTFDAHIDKKRLEVSAKYAGKKVGLVMDVKPGKGSRIRTPQGKRSAEVASSSVRKQGNAVIQEATIGSVRYVLDEDTHRFGRSQKNDTPFTLMNGARINYSGIITSHGELKPFQATMKLNFKKKK